MGQPLPFGSRLTEQCIFGKMAKMCAHRSRERQYLIESVFPASRIVVMPYPVARFIIYIVWPTLSPRMPICSDVGMITATRMHSRPWCGHGAWCRASVGRVIGNSHDADDAFQAVFLILARKAGSLRHPSALVGWLHGVALRAGGQSPRRRFEIVRRCHAPAPEICDPHLNPLDILSLASC